MKKVLSTTIFLLGSYVLLSATPESENISSESILIENEVSHELSQTIKDHVSQVVEEALIQMSDTPIKLHITIHDGRLEVGQPLAESESNVIDTSSLELGVETCVESEFTRSMKHSQVIANEVIKPMLIEYGNFTTTDELVDEFRVELFDSYEDIFSEDDIKKIKEAKSTSELIAVLSEVEGMINLAYDSLANDLKKAIESEYGPVQITGMITTTKLLDALKGMDIKLDDLSEYIVDSLEEVQEEEVYDYRTNAVIISTKQIEELMIGAQKLNALRNHLWAYYSESEGYNEKAMNEARSSEEIITAMKDVDEAADDPLAEQLLKVLISYEEAGYFTFLDPENPPNSGDFDEESINDIYGYFPLAFTMDDTIDLDYVLNQGRHAFFNPDLFYNSGSMYEMIFEYMKFFIIKDFVEPTIPEEFFDELRVSYDCWYGHYADLWGEAWNKECDTDAQSRFDGIIWTLTKYVTDFIQQDRRLNKAERFDKHSFDHISKKKWLKSLSEGKVMCRFDQFRNMN